jgi:hypothetical protein
VEDYGTARRKINTKFAYKLINLRQVIGLMGHSAMSSSLLVISAQDNFRSLTQFGVYLILIEALGGVPVENEQQVSLFVH